VTRGQLVTFWSSPNFELAPPRRSFPWPATRLERLATRAGISDEDLRVLLEREIARRQAATRLGRAP